jgi:hypothetical protein
MGLICFSKREVEGIFAEYFASVIVNDDGAVVFQRTSLLQQAKKSPHAAGMVGAEAIS